MRPKRIFVLTILTFMGPFMATFFIVLFIVLMQFLWKYIDDLVGKGLGWLDIGQLLFFASASFVPIALPLAVLLSSIMCFGQLAERYELAALKSAGISLVRTMMPLTFLMLVFSGGAFLFANDIIPYSNLKFRSLLYDIMQQRPALEIPEKAFYRGIDGYQILIDSKSKDGKTLQGITVYDHTMDRGNVTVITAKSGKMEQTENGRYLQFTLYDGQRDEEIAPQSRIEKNTYPHSRLKFGEYQIKFDLSGFKLSRTDENLFKSNYEMLNLAQLTEYSDSVISLSDARRGETMGYMGPYFKLIQDSSIVKASGSGVIAQPFDSFNTKAAAERAMNNLRILNEITSMQAQEIDNYQDNLVRYEIEWHRKFSLSLACFALFFIGSPLGAIIKKGGIGMPSMVALVMFIIYYAVSKIGEQAAKEGAMIPWVGMWLPIMSLLPIGLFLTYLSNNDRISFSTDGINRIFRRLKKKRRTAKLQLG